MLTNVSVSSPPFLSMSLQTRRILVCPANALTAWCSSGLLGELSLIPENVLQEPVEPVHRAIRSLLAVVDMQCRMLSTEEGRSSLSPLVIQTILSACTLLAKTYFMFSPASYQKSKMSVFKHAPGCYAGRMTLRIETDLPITDP